MFKHRSIAVLIILIAATVIIMPLFNRFTVSDGKTGEIVFIESTSKIKEFHISFLHSVNRTPVNEYYRISNNKFIVYKTTFFSYGAGMPEYDASGAQKLKVEDGVVSIDNINRALEDFTVMVGTYADHCLNYGGKSIRLSELIEPQKPAKFRVQRVSALDILRLSMKQESR